jgi:signal transduction histidine kinase
LPLNEKARERIQHLTRELKPHLAEITTAWRSRTFQESNFDGRVMAALERLNLGTGLVLCCPGDFNTFFENLNYFGKRLAKLQVDTRAVARSLEIYQAAAEPYLAALEGELRAESRAALDLLCSAAFVAVSGAYFDTQTAASAALLSILDAELSAANLPALLGRILEIASATFGATVGAVLLLDPDIGELRATASFGLEGALDPELTIPLGRGFSGQIAQTGEPAVLPDLGRSDGVLNPLLREKARALWGVPLKSGEPVIGVLLIGFDKPYEWLPTERELLRSIADRSALAIDRARMTDALREREARIAELSAHLLSAQEEERKRISRELHDETGQALMVIRLYLGMLETAVSARSARGKIRETLEVVDRTIEGLRRTIARLSPLVLQELGLVAAIRKEAKDLARNTGVKARVAVAENVGRLAPQTETAIYRVVQEALHNVAKHAQAKAVNIQMFRESSTLRLIVEDDGVGMKPKLATPGRSFGLAGMRERISTLGGVVKISSGKGHGTRLEVSVPVGQPVADEVARGLRLEPAYLARGAAATGRHGPM